MQSRSTARGLTVARRVWWPISQDDDPTSRRRRLRAVMRDLDLRATGLPCPDCEETARLAGGEGCACRAGVDELAGRLLTLADQARGDAR